MWHFACACSYVCMLGGIGGFLVEIHEACVMSCVHNRGIHMRTYIYTWAYQYTCARLNPVHMLKENNKRKKVKYICYGTKKDKCIRWRLLNLKRNYEFLLLKYCVACLFINNTYFPIYFLRMHSLNEYTHARWRHFAFFKIISFWFTNYVFIIFFLLHVNHEHAVND